MTMTKMTAGWVLSTSPKQLLCKSLVSPIFRPFLGTDLQRFHNGGITDLQRRQNEGCNRDLGDWCNTLAMKKRKKFLEGVLHHLLLCVIFLLIISALDAV